MAIDHVRSLIETALVSEDDPRTERAFEALGARAGSLVVAATFALAVMKRFPEHAGLEEIRDFVVAARTRLTVPEKGPQLLMEGLIRSILGEGHLAREVPNDRVMPIESWLIYIMVGQMYPTPDGKKSFVDEASELATEWLGQAKLI